MSQDDGEGQVTGLASSVKLVSWQEETLSLKDIR